MEARAGFEPANSGFADRRLGPLGYRAGLKYLIMQYYTNKIYVQDLRFASVSLSFNLMMSNEKGV